MAFDGKYGEVTTQFGDLGDDEPVIVFRARDKVLPDLLDEYRRECMRAGSPAFHLRLIGERIAEIQAWQEAHPDLVRVPSSESYQKRSGA